MVNAAERIIIFAKLSSCNCLTWWQISKTIIYRYRKYCCIHLHPLSCPDSNPLASTIVSSPHLFISPAQAIIVKIAFEFSPSRSSDCIVNCWHVYWWIHVPLLPLNAQINVSYPLVSPALFLSLSLFSLCMANWIDKNRLCSLLPSPRLPCCEWSSCVSLPLQGDLSFSGSFFSLSLSLSLSHSSLFVSPSEGCCFFPLCGRVLTECLYLLGPSTLWDLLICLLVKRRMTCFGPSRHNSFTIFCHSLARDEAAAAAAAAATATTTTTCFSPSLLFSLLAVPVPGKGQRGSR